MDAEEQRRLYRLIRRVNAERRTVTEHLQSRSRQLDVTLSLLRSHLESSGLTPREVTLRDPIEPVHEGACLHKGEDRARPYQHIKQSDTPRRSAQPWWPSLDDPSGPLKPSPGWQNIKLLDKSVRTVGVLLLGCAPQTIEKVVATFLRQQTQRQDFIPVFIVDTDRVDPFLQHGFVVEIIPPPEDQALYVGSRPWHDYIMDRLIGVRDKWYVVQFLEFGKTRYSIRGIVDEQTDADEAEMDAEGSPTFEGPGGRGRHAAE